MTKDELVNSEIIAESFRLLLDQGGASLFEEFKKLEPSLADFVIDRAEVMAGRMALRRQPRHVITACHVEMLELAALCFHAQRLAQAELWQDLVADGQYPAVKTILDGGSEEEDGGPDEEEELGGASEASKGGEDEGPF